MRVIGGIEIINITEDDIVSSDLVKQIRRHKESSRIWKYLLAAVIVGFLVQYGIRFILGDRMAGELSETRIGFFLLTFMTICFILFAIFFMMEKNFLEKKWGCPGCGEGFSYIKSESRDGVQCGRKSFILDCNTLGIKQAIVGEGPLIVPCTCPNCNEIIWKKDNNISN